MCDTSKVLEEAYTNDYIGMRKEDLGRALDIFEEDFSDRDAGWLNWEVEAIRKWIKNKA